LIAEVGRCTESDVLLAAVLHDTIEDTGTKKEEIESLFGSEVAEVVMELTDDKTLPKEERKRLQVYTASKKSKKAKIVKLADKICNVRDIILAPPDWDLDRKLKYFDWAEEVVEGLKGANEPLEKLFAETVESARKKLLD
jgi:GTP diphosphokinase / guanosine-3',5'-bis(diphosphate) 3'-diphosphatase